MFKKGWRICFYSEKNLSTFDAAVRCTNNDAKTPTKFFLTWNMRCGHSWRIFDSFSGEIGCHCQMSYVKWSDIVVGLQFVWLLNLGGKILFNDNRRRNFSPLWNVKPSLLLLLKALFSTCGRSNVLCNGIINVHTKYAKEVTVVLNKLQQK